ncbi:BRO family protein [Chondrinema litorale]|uniref:BRO family protein n=1 Tax=Chondrinema litorale TaxID=2994555 RepID=UPI002542AF2C|nr:BRO family protein [Chondrinema litorale]UZR98430.1 BRO family protein [Chondrinema litorale]
MEEIKLFDSKEIRTIWFEGQLYFSVVDVIEVLTESKNAKVYWSQLKSREKKRVGSELFTFCKQLKLQGKDTKSYKTDCAEKQGLLRIIQSIPSPKAEPFKLWLANLGSREIDERDNKRLEAYRKLKDTQGKFKNNVVDRGVDDEGFKRILKSGDDEIFNNANMHEKYGLDTSEDIDDYSSELILRGKDFATLITNHNVSSKDIQGEKDIEKEHKESNKDIRLTLDKHNIRPEELPAEEDIKKYKQIKKLDGTE